MIVFIAALQIRNNRGRFILNKISMAIEPISIYVPLIAAKDTIKSLKDSIKSLIAFSPIDYCIGGCKGPMVAVGTIVTLGVTAGVGVMVGAGPGIGSIGASIQ